jgi:hypothetical protein
MKHMPTTLALVLALAQAQVEARIIACRHIYQYNGEGAITTDVTLNATQAIVSRVAVEQTTELYQAKTGYTCSATLTNGAPNNKWEARGRETDISVEPDESGEPSSLAIIRVRGGYILKTKKLSRTTCGVRGEWPAKIYVPLAGGKCKVLHD